VEELIGNYGDVGALTILVGMMVWYLKYQTKRQAEREDKHDAERAKREEKCDAEQKEERNYYRNLVAIEIGKLHKDSLRNAELNEQSIMLIKNMNKNMEIHNGQSEKVSKKMVESLGLICDRLNGGSNKMIKAKKMLSEKI